MPVSRTLSPEVIESAMRRALTLAERGPSTDVNPQVGCVILGPQGEFVAEGWHEGAGTPHAEIAAMQHLSDEHLAEARRLTVVVTLEPCNHQGRTGPCAQALSAAGFAEVVYGMADPGQESAGGASTLRAAGIPAVGGVLEEEARALLASWVERSAANARAGSSAGSTGGGGS
ncbi:bifunctional diaminohydroxyphosphoribosylaminopyrimidine deaminase/5-amino-6-(5-phosphoribosylamino)uracil reductase RibD [Leucobacter denitrificans]|uniref:bifunctional diaminohydroxyphosphoribosylaminopyrimidine deaminase/5-amino-6-(5-phosphoribosylamino)uracil reductase RibD n=1 Tax=Leucobacter denitrificans TaxID=683042 RepID=UPI0031B61E80